MRIRGSPPVGSPGPGPALPSAPSTPPPSSAAAPRLGSKLPRFTLLAASAAAAFDLPGPSKPRSSITSDLLTHSFIHSGSLGGRRPFLSLPPRSSLLSSLLSSSGRPVLPCSASRPRRSSPPLLSSPLLPSPPLLSS